MIRFATLDDCPGLAALSCSVWMDTYARDGVNRQCADYVLSTFTVDAYAALINSASHRLLIAEENECIRGFALVNFASHFEHPDHGFELERLYIHAPFQRDGFGRALLRAVCSEIGDKFWLYTWVHNEANQYYAHLGFERIGTYKFMFADSEIENNVYGFDGSHACL